MNKEEIEELKDFTIDITDIDELALGLEVCSKKSNMVIQEFADIIIQLQQENKRLKKQLEDKTEDYKRMKDNFDSKVDVLTKIDTQQKEFIEYLENKIYSIEPKGTGINYNCEYDSEEDYISAMKEQSKLNTLKEILQKYKEIIGGK